MRKLIIILYLLSIHFLQAQDSIQQLINKKEYAVLLQNISKDVDSGKFEKAIILGNRVLAIIPNEDEYSGRFLSLLGTAEWYLGNIKKGDSLFQESIIFSKKHSDSLTLSKVYFNLGYIYLSNGKYTASLQAFFDAEKYAKNQCVALSKIKDYISYVYITQQKLEEAKPFIQEAFQIAIQCEDSTHIVNMHNSIGHFYSLTPQKDSALYHLNQAQKLAKKINYKDGKAIALSNLTDWYIQEKQYEKALIYSKESFALDKQLNDTEGQAYSYAQLAKIYKEQGNYIQAITNVNNAIRLVDILGATNLKVDFLQLKAAIEIAQRDWKKATQTLTTHYTLKDSLTGVKKTKDLNDIMEKYETDKLKQAKIIAEKEEENAKQLAVKNRNLFVVSVVVGLLVLCMALFYIYQIRLKKRAELAEIQLQKAKETLQLERKLSQAELNTIRSQMNPHFLFNAFNSIQEYIILNERELASDYLGKFSDLMRLFLDQSRQKTIVLEDEIETLSLYLDLEKIRFEETLQITIHCDEILDTSHIEIPPMLIQPFIENSLKHGLATKIGTKKINVSFTKNNNYLTCTVEDNGVGRKQAALINEQKMRKHKSFATSATQNRIDLLNVGKENKINIKITDLYNAEGETTGTRVLINIPII